MTTMTRDEVVRLLEPTERMDTLVFTPGPNFGFEQKPIGDEETPQLVFHAAGMEALVPKEAWLKLGQRLKIPASYSEKVPVALMIPHVNHFFALNDGQFTAFIQNDGGVPVVQHFSEGERRPISNIEILDVVDDVLKESLDVGAISYSHVHHNLYDTTINVKLPVEQDMTSGTVRKGDIVAGGISLNTSFVMEHPLDVASYTERLICTNGAISTSNVFRLTRRYGGDPDEWLREAIGMAFRGIDDEMRALRETQEVRIQGHVSNALQSIFTEFSVPTHVRELINQRVIDLPAETLYDVVQVITDVASNDEDIRANPALQRRLMQVGSNVTRHRDFCDSCHRIIA